MERALRLTRTGSFGLLAFVIGVFPIVAAAQSTSHGPCPPGKQQVENVCVEDRIINFTKCLGQTSGGKANVTTVDPKKINEVATSLTFAPDLVRHCKELSARPQANRQKQSPKPAQSPALNEAAPPTQPEKAPDPVQVFLQQGIDALAFGTLESAKDAFTRAYDLSGRRSAEAAGRLGLVELQIGKKSEAAVALTRALADTDSAWVHDNRSSLTDWLNQANERPPGSTDLQNGIDFETSNQLVAAQAAYQRAYDVSNRKAAEAAGHLGLVEVKLGDRKNAVEHLQRALDDTNDPWVTGHRSTLEQALKAVVETDPPPPEPGSRQGLRMATWGVAGLGVVAAGAAIWALAAGAGTNDEIAKGGLATSNDITAAADRGQTRNGIAAVSLITAGACAGAFSLLEWKLQTPESSTTDQGHQVRVVPTPTSISIAGRFP